MPPKHDVHIPNDYPLKILILCAIGNKIPAAWIKDHGCFFPKLVEGIELGLRGNDGKQVHHLYGPLPNLRSLDPLGGCRGKEEHFQHF